MALKRKMKRPAGGPARKKRYMQRKPRIPRAIVPSRFAVKRVRFQETWVFSTATTSGFWRYYTWNNTNFNAFNEFSALFDEYKINALKYTFRPAYDTVDISVASGATPTGAQAYAHVVVDPSSTVIPSGTYTSAVLNGFLENSGVKTYTLNKPFSVYFKPKVQDQLLGGGTGTRTLRPTYIKTSEAVDHRGFHMFLQQNAVSTVNTAIKLDVFITAYATFRNLK